MGWLQTEYNRHAAYNERRCCVFRVGDLLVDYTVRDENPEQLCSFFALLLQYGSHGQYADLSIMGFQFDFSQANWMVGCYGAKLESVPKGQLLPEITLTFTREEGEAVRHAFLEWKAL